MSNENDERPQSRDNEVDSNFAGLNAPRFSLRFLLLLPAFLGGLIILFTRFGGLAGAIFLLAAAIVTLHVAGSAIGTKLRDNADRAKVGNLQSSPLARESAKEHFAPTTTLSHTVSLGLPVQIAVLVGLSVGAALGYLVLGFLYPNELPVPIILIGIVCSSALGGILSFWLWSLLQVATTCLRQAHSSSSKELRESKRRRK